ncbi:secreted RxLR effector protein 161-like [Pistacia vera]|uniref:secreted RxLR effector protein 161-like n=1 Tax=Pistacia vera TaxID=55513 RepID=UPI0012639B6F|nr:secreted RxLR effector protein 161-like [Pistacia vera]
MSPKTDKECERMREIPYASAVGILMYAMLCTRPDIAYVVSVTSKYQSDPGEKYWSTVKTILRKSTSGFVFICNGGAVSWTSSKQSSIADSTTKAEYIAVSEAEKGSCLDAQSHD